LGNGEGLLPTGVNVRGAGGYAVGPGAVRPDGARYRTADDATDLVTAFAKDTIPVVPDWPVDIVRGGGRNLPLNYLQVWRGDSSVSLKPRAGDDLFGGTLAEKTH